MTDMTSMAKNGRYVKPWKIVHQRELSCYPCLIMGICNLSTESFSACLDEPQQSIKQRVEKLIERGADIIDIGAESTRPGATPVSADREIQELSRAFDELSLPLAKTDGSHCPISIDTYHVKTMAWALTNGADIINDIGKIDSADIDKTNLLENTEPKLETNTSVLTEQQFNRDRRVFELIADHHAGYIMMAYGQPEHTQDDLSYQSLLDNIRSHLADRIKLAQQCGVSIDQITVDPGIGFGKGMHHDARLLTCSPALSSLGTRVLIGHSRKRFLGYIGQVDIHERKFLTCAASTLAIFSGADIIRVHDPLPTYQARQLCGACLT